MNASWVGILIPGIILVAGVIDDLRSRKVHNWLVLSLIALATLSTFLLYGFDGLKVGLLGGAVAIGLILPMVMIGMMGAGDLKLMIAFGIATDGNTALWTILYSFIWGALLGVFQAILKGQSLALLKNTLSVATNKVEDKSKLHRIPYTVALFFGWLTHLSLQGWGG